MDERDIVDLAMREPSWEEVITYCITQEGLDPWDVDIVKLTAIFLQYMKKMEELDFKVPARFVLLASIFLRLQMEALFPAEEKEEEVEQARIEIGELPELIPPVAREPRKKITLDELIVALRKAFAVEERRLERKTRIRQRVEEIIPEEEDVEARIEELYKRIVNGLKKSKKESITFSSLVKFEIIRFFLPLLHLDQERKIRCEQPEFFREIFIRLEKLK